MKLERARGTRDFAAEDALLRQQIVATLRQVFELYGYNPLETPILERFETLASKYAGGDEILKETFKLKDQGGRELGLRYDLTVPMCRFIATNPNLKMPFKRYQIGEVFRDGPLKIGRYREFAQCDVDIVGVKSMAADAEMVEVALDVFKKLNLTVEIEINSIKILNVAMELMQIPKEKRVDFILTLDKLKKIGIKGVIEELKQKNLMNYSVEIPGFLNTLLLGKLDEMEAYLKTIADRRKKLLNLDEDLNGFSDIRAILTSVNSQTVKFNGALARGLAYYTGTVFEVFLKKSEITSAVAAGGRYDKMIGSFVGSGREYPAVGISFGLDVIEDALGIVQKERKKTTTQAYVIPVKTVAEAQKIASQLRKNGINTDIDLNGRDVKKNGKRGNRNSCRGNSADESLIFCFCKNLTPLSFHQHRLLRLADNALCLLDKRREALDSSLLPKNFQCQGNFDCGKLFQEPPPGKRQLLVAADFVKNLSCARVPCRLVRCLHENLSV
ncbi:histidine--tRNA ligase [Candidatus Woesearchaeota archaeon]|nr:histidine--tRNA ligase [Candidatus Woesearchaeota archaeon]